MPPRCFVCDRGLRDLPGPMTENFALVYFADATPTPPGAVGHPGNAVWFCREHEHLGRQREAMTADAALTEIAAFRSST